MKQALKRIVPARTWQLAREIHDSIRRAPELPAAYFHPWRRESIRRLAAFKNVHKGQRAFVIGNGPSLKHTNLAKLKDEFTFGLNRIYLLFPELGFHTTYYAATNDLVIEQFNRDILELPMPKFLAWRSRRHFPAALQLLDIPTFLYTSYTGLVFQRMCPAVCGRGLLLQTLPFKLPFTWALSR